MPEKILQLRENGAVRALVIGLWKQRRIDLVTVATPNSTHYEITRAFLEAGINVLCEKP